MREIHFFIRSRFLRLAVVRSNKDPKLLAFAIVAGLIRATGFENLPLTV